jgi:hypothetical protein
MDCQQAQESILESLIERLDAEEGRALERHVADCEACGSFAKVHGRLDAMLAAAVPAARLSPGFRNSLRKQIRRDARSAWPEFLPDVAHLLGCALVIVMSLSFVPLPASRVFFWGLAFTLVTFFLQATVRSYLEKVE